MPHLVIEYSAPIKQRISVIQLVQAVQKGAVDSQLFEPTAIKCRAISFDEYLVAGQRSDFVHVSVHILSGRSPQQKRHLSAIVMAALQSLKLEQVSLTAEIVDMDRDSYAKELM